MKVLFIVYIDQSSEWADYRADYDTNERIPESFRNFSNMTFANGESYIGEIPGSL